MRPSKIKTIPCPLLPNVSSRSRFLPSDPTYQDIHQQPLLLTLAYTQALQYWVEKVSLPMLGGYCPLVMSIVELRWQVEGHFTFSKQDIFCNLEGTVSEARSKDTEVPQEGAIAPPTTDNYWGCGALPPKDPGGR